MYTPLWLNYEMGKSNRKLGKIFSLETNPIIKNAIEELKLAFTCDVEGEPDVYLMLDSSGEEEHFQIQFTDNSIELTSSDERGLFYATSKLIQLARLGKLEKGLSISDGPETELRMIDHWDNMDGSIERGYSGKSFFFAEEKVLVNDRTVFYARALASIGINAICFNNVNVVASASELITERYFEDLNGLFQIFAEYGITPYLSLNYASPIQLGGLKTADPCSTEVIKWWEKVMSQVFSNLPDLGGFVVKADSEGRPGPFTYGRNQAEGANMLAKVLQPYGANVIWRAFVYNCKQDWRDHKTDRARAAFDYFSPLDGQFEDNVYLQIKNGPMDFQVREPISPLFWAMPRTNLILEFQIAQEYTGQQIDLCYLVPMWQEILGFPEISSTDSVSKRFAQPNTGIAAVSNTGNDENWTGHYLAQANLYGFGILAWNHQANAEQIVRDWLQQSFPLKEEVIQKITVLMMKSWQTMEKYTAPLGIGWMVTPHYHYGPNIDGYEYSAWGTYHRADHHGIGIERTIEGTGYASLYPESIAENYEKIESCPDNLLLFFHHVPYTHNLQSGKTVLQHIYDSHFEGYEEVEQFRDTWLELENELPPEVWKHVKERFERQLQNVREWRDQINTYFHRLTNTEDIHNRKIYN